MTHPVKIVQIQRVEKHPNADRLDLVHIDGWQCVAGRGQYKPGDRAIYIPIDSILSPRTEAQLFPPDSKIKLNKSRVRTIKIRGAISQGMLADPLALGISTRHPIGYDVGIELGITKFEPPAPPPQMVGNATSKKRRNPYFREYGGLDNWKHYPTVFTPEDEVIITEKIHGTNFRAGWLPVAANTWWKKALAFVGLLPKWEFVWGSNRVQLQGKRYNSYYKNDVYSRVVHDYDLPNVLKKGEVIYGEIYGDGIQKGYSYGCKPGEIKLVVFDLWQHDFSNKTGYFTNAINLDDWCDERKLPMVPILYEGKYDEAMAKELTHGTSVLEPSQAVREGVVIKPYAETSCMSGRKALKLISDEYLLRDNTDFH